VLHLWDARETEGGAALRTKACAVRMTMQKNEEKGEAKLNLVAEGSAQMLANPTTRIMARIEKMPRLCSAKGVRKRTPPYNDPAL